MSQFRSQNTRGARRFHAIKVATSATFIVAAAAVIVAVVLNLILVDRLIHGVDTRLSEQLVDSVGVASGPGLTHPLAVRHRDQDVEQAPLFVWRVAATGAPTPLTLGAPALPVRHWATRPATLTVAGGAFRLDTVRLGSGWLVAGEGIRQVTRIRDELLIAEGLLGTLLLIVTFPGALLVGLRASAPIEQIRRRQSEFTADASHELRTPLSVIEAEVDLALSRPRDQATYQSALRRVSDESARLRSIVDDLLWLARADGDLPDNTSFETVDVASVAESCVDRFAAVAEARDIDLTFCCDGHRRPLVRAPADSIERLTSVLVDNACRYAGDGGIVDVRVELSGARVTLTIDDSGPGIPEEHRELVFDRFHRATDAPGGTGLGLAIADAVVRATHGTWFIGRSPLGGARMAVSWRSAPVHPSRTRASESEDAGDWGPSAGPAQPSAGPDRTAPEPFTAG